MEDQQTGAKPRKTGVPWFGTRRSKLRILPPRPNLLSFLTNSLQINSLEDPRECQLNPHFAYVPEGSPGLRPGGPEGACLIFPISWRADRRLAETLPFSCPFRASPDARDLRRDRPGGWARNAGASGQFGLACQLARPVDGLPAQAGQTGRLLTVCQNRHTVGR